MGKRKLRKSEQREAVAQYVQYCKDGYALRGDLGAFGKMAEVLVREHINPILREGDIRARREDKVDCTFRAADGSMVQLEVKTGCGALAYEYEEDEIEIERLLPGVRWIAYNPQYCENMTTGTQFFVMTRNEFLEMLVDYNPSKPLTWFKMNKARKQVNIQSFTNSNKKYEYLLDSLCEFPTLDEFLEEQRG